MPNIWRCFKKMTPCKSLELTRQEINEFLLFDLFMVVNNLDEDSKSQNTEQKFCLKKLMDTDTENMIFKINLNSYSNGYSKKQYFEINLKRLNGKIIVQIINISSRFIEEYDAQQAHNEVLNVINAGVSHELRNPLNAIQA